MDMELQALRKGFDSLDVAFTGCVSASIRKVFADAKARATSNNEPEYIEFNGLKGSVQPLGARGGYAWVFDTGPDGEIWTIKDNLDPSNWNIRVSVRSANLGVNGYANVKASIFDALRRMGIRTHSNDGDILVGNSVGRVDYAVDFILPGFSLSADLFVCHSHSTVSEYAEIPSGGSEFGVRYSGRRITSVTVGKMPGRQVIVYDKRLEQRRKVGSPWFRIWGFEADNCPEIWRVEVRAGKDHLKEWKITTLEEMEEKIGTVYADALASIRFLKEHQENVSNISRAADHELWETMRKEVSEGLSDACNPAIRGKVIEGRKEEIKEMYFAQMVGLSAGYAVASGLTHQQAEQEIAARLGREIGEFVSYCSNDFAKKYKRASNRLFFINDNEGGRDAGTNGFGGPMSMRRGGSAYA